MPDNHLTHKERQVMTPEAYIADRVDNQIAWYSRKSNLNKKGFIVFQIMTFVASASVPVFAMFSGDIWARVTVAILGSATAITTGIVSLYQFREHWIEYRTTAESLKHEKYLYQTGMSHYSGDNAFSVLVERVEALVSQENTAWQQRLKTQKAEEKSDTLHGG